ncbi:hypothetical protein ART_2016 [Arthrobacter sp. PAMC 25486]|nr:hypothetical protein ART_2016 [Arthrobacter sp. PAMC 25486]
MSDIGDNEIEEQVGVVTATLAQLPGILGALEHACPWLVEVRERSPGAHREAVGSLIVGYSRGSGALREAIQEWAAFAQPMEPWC